MTPAVFLDRDGTLIGEKDYLGDPEGVAVIDGAGAALRRVMDAGYLLVIVTNQSGIGRGYYTEADMHRVNDRVIEEFAKAGVRFAKIYFAPEAPEEPSRGRKPSPEFLFDARDQLEIDLGRSFMVGDKLVDLQCGWNAGVKRSLLVRTGHGEAWEAKLGKDAGRAVVVDNVVEAAKWILNRA